MAVEVYGHLNRTMPHLIFHIDRAFAVLQQKRGKRMA